MVCLGHGRSVLRTVYKGNSFLPSRPTTSLTINPRILPQPSLDVKSIRCRCSRVQSEVLDMSDAVDVTRHNFDAAIKSIKEAVEECDFVAFDCEMTGLFLDNNEGSYLDDMPLRYYKMHASARKFLVNQFGIAAFTRGAGGAYSAKTFNLNIFPRSFQGSETRFTCQASSLEYLAQHKFDFNKMVYDGIPYLPLQQKRRLLQSAERPRKYFRREPSTASAKQLISDIQAAVRDWHGAAAEPSIRVAQGCRPAERVFAYQALEGLQLGDEGSPGFYVEKVGEGMETSLLVTRATKAELAQHEKREKQKKLEEIEAAAGFTAVMSILQAAGKPVVGHNMLFDLIYVLNIFVADFPTWSEFNAAAEAWFPGGIYDTKHLTNALERTHAARAAAAGNGGGNGGDSSAPLFDSTTLGDLYEALVEGKRPDGATARWRELLGDGDVTVPRVEHAEGFTRYSGTDGAAFAHEAGFDAFMTGAVFTAVLQLHRASNAAVTAADPAAPVLLGRPQQPGTTTAPALSSDADTPAEFDLSAVAQLANRVHVMRMNAPHCVVATGDDPVISRRGLAVLATRVPARLPERKAAYTAFAGAVAEVGRVEGLRLEEMVATGPWAAWAASTWGQADPDAYIDKLVTVLKANNSFRKCQFMTWSEFDAWKRHFPETDPYSPNGRSGGDDGGGSGSDDGGTLLQSLLGNNCAVM